MYIRVLRGRGNDNKKNTWLLPKRKDLVINYNMHSTKN